MHFMHKISVSWIELFRLCIANFEKLTAVGLFVARYYKIKKIVEGFIKFRYFQGYNARKVI